MFNLKSGWWTWLNGSSSVNQIGSCGSLGVAAGGNVPGAREWHAMVIDSASQALYLLGGYGYDASGAFGNTCNLLIVSTIMNLCLH